MFTFPLSFAFETTEQEQETKMSSDRKASMELSKWNPAILMIGVEGMRIVASKYSRSKEIEI